MKVKLFLIIVIFFIYSAKLYSQIRETAVAGAFYPSDADDLKKTVSKYTYPHQGKAWLINRSS